MTDLQALAGRVSGIWDYIHRCGQIFGFKPRPTGSTLDTSDGLCLDGNKLIPDRRTAGVYHTEREAFSRIVRAGDQFTVYKRVDAF